MHQQLTISINDGVYNYIHSISEMLSINSAISTCSKTNVALKMLSKYGYSVLSATINESAIAEFNQVNIIFTSARNRISN